MGYFEEMVARAEANAEAEMVPKLAQICLRRRGKTSCFLRGGACTYPAGFS
jgi:hypothetical protein